MPSRSTSTVTTTLISFCNRWSASCRMSRLWCRISELVRGTDSDAALYGSLELRLPREIVGNGPRFSLRHAPCAHICRYCLISESRKRSALPFSRLEQLVHRFHDWQQSERPNLE